MKKTIVFLLVTTLLAVGLATGFRVDGARAKKALDEAEGAQRALEVELKAAEIRLAQAAQPAADADGVPVSVLRDRISELEQHLKQKDSELKGLREQAKEVREESEEAPQQARAPERSPEDWRQRQRERMEQLRQEDPEEYTRIQQERRDFQQRVVDNLGGQVEFLAELSTEGLAAEQLENHQALLARLSSFRQKVSQVSADPVSDEGGVSRRELFQEFREIAPLMEKERQVVLNNLAIDLGYAPDEAQSFVEYVDFVNEMTSPRAIMRGVGGGMGGRTDRGGR